MKRRDIVLGSAAAVGLATYPVQASAQVRGVTTTEVVIGSILPLSGSLATWGVPERNGLVIAVDEINARGGVAGRKLRLIVEDSAYETKLALQAAEKLIKRDQVFAFVGLFGTSIVLTLLPMLKEHNIPSVFPQTGDPAAWTPPDDLKFGYLYPNPDQARAATKFFVAERGHKKIGVLFQADEFGQGIYDGVVEQLKRMKLDLGGEASYKRGATRHVRILFGICAAGSPVRRRGGGRHVRNGA
jgi:ABC-type branched-subunit amino acid transport system substrate-binding protein